MKKSLFVILLSLAAVSPALAEEPAATPAQIAAPAVVAERGQMVVAADGVRIGPVRQLADDGSPRVVYEGRVVTVPLSSLTLAEGRLVSSLTRAEILAAQH